VVTNYDTLVEQAFNSARKPYDLVVHLTDSKEFANAVLWWPHGSLQPQAVAPNLLANHITLAQTTVIYKMHGTICETDCNWDSFVITEEDYVDFLSRMTSNVAIPAIFNEHCRERSFLFLGYSLSDWNLRVILKNLNRAFSRRTAQEEKDRVKSWAIQKNPSELECRLWQNRGVNIYDIDIERFVVAIRKFMRPPK
jgi:hypothetical protein